MRSVERLRRPASDGLLAQQETRIRPLLHGPPKWRAVSLQGPSTESPESEARDLEHLDLPPRERLRMGLRIGIPYAVAALVLAISFGVLAEPIMGKVAPIVMSALVFAGLRPVRVARPCSQPAAARVAAIVAGVLLNLRYVPMGIALAPSLARQARWRRAADRPGDDRLLLGGGQPRRRPLRPWFMIGATTARPIRAGSAGR